jgi:hypothetical protein
MSASRARPHHSDICRPVALINLDCTRATIAHLSNQTGHFNWRSFDFDIVGLLETLNTRPIARMAAE